MPESPPLDAAAYSPRPKPSKRVHGLRLQRPVVTLLVLVGCAPASGPAPALLGVSPDLACDAGVSVEVSIHGTGFAPAPTGVLSSPGLALPTLTLDRSSDLTGTADDLPGSLLLSPVDGTLRWLDAETLAFDASAALGLRDGAWDVTVHNPDGQSDTLAAGLLWAAPPTLSDIAPAAVCVDSGAAPLLLIGEGFLVVGGVGPTVTIGGAPVEASALDCAPLAGGRDGEVCTTLALTVDASTLPLGTASVSVTNPSPAECPAPSAATIEVTLPPTISTVEPGITCADGGTIVVTGERLPEDPIVTVGGVPAASVTVLDGATLEIVIGAGTPDGLVEVVVASADGCSASATVEIVGEPDVFLVDPSTLYDRLSIDVTAWVADLSADITDVWITDPDGVVTDLTFTWEADTPGRVRATVPAGLPAGVYSFGIGELDGCAAELPDALTITDTLTVSVDALEPGFAWTYDYTAVQVYTEDPIPSGEVGFLETPRVYVSQTGGGGSAAAVTGVLFRDETLLTATIPPGLDPGVYDVIVVNPDGGVGVLERGLTVSEDHPPEVESVTPPGLQNSHDETITVRGSNFRDPTVSLTCRSDGAEQTVSATVTVYTPTSIEATVPTSSLDVSVCVITVTNGDGAAARWAALSIRNPAENLFPWSAGTDMVVARRAPGAVAGRTTSVSRWVYAMGGDDGDSTSALTSIERAPIGVYGDLGEWQLLTGHLPNAITLGGAAIVRNFVYVVGGNDGAGPVATGWRARILDPLDVPRFEELSIGDEGTLGAGTWTWRVSALYDVSDVGNPGGESLPGDPIYVTLPERGGLDVALQWTAVAGATGYRVYRGSAAGDTDVAWIGDTTDTLLHDDGLVADPSRLPLIEGALGEWAALPTLLDPREGLCVAVAPDPIPDPEIVYLYAAGGREDDEHALDSVEVLDIQVVSDNEQRAGAWTHAGVELEDGRYGCGAWTVDSSRHSVVDEGETWIYFGGGESERRTVGTVEAARVGAYGDLEEFGEIDAMSPARSGFGMASAGDFLYAFGGQNGSPSAGGVSGELGVEPMPEVRNWNSLGTSLTVSRRWPGSAQESAVIVIAGGETDSESATRSTDVTNW